MDARVVAGGGGDAAASYAGHARFASWLGREASVLYLPVAMGWETATLQAADAWFRSAFEEFGVSRITTCFASATLEAVSFDSYDGVYIGGGNAYLLMSLLRESGAGEGLKQALAEGLPLYGGSAGAIILGTTIQSAAHLDEDIVGLNDLRGLDVIAEHAIWPHYEEQQLDDVITFARETGGQTLAVPESGAVVWESGLAWSAGATIPRCTADGPVGLLPPYAAGRDPSLPLAPRPHSGRSTTTKGEMNS